MLPDLSIDPFGERMPLLHSRRLQLLGARFDFDSNSLRLMKLVDAAYAGLPGHRLPATAPLTVRLLLTSPTRHRPPDPPQLAMLSGGGLLAAAAHQACVVTVCPEQRIALLVVPPEQLRHAYHTRYEMLEFAVFTLAARAQGLVPLHAACVGHRGRGILLMGPSGAGKSTVAMLCLQAGLDFVSEDSVFVASRSLLATGVANFLHVREDSLKWLDGATPGDGRLARAIRRSSVIRRRSGVEKFEVDLRRGGHSLAPAPVRIVATVFLSAKPAGDRPLLRPLSSAALGIRLDAAQPYAAHQAPWAGFRRRSASLPAFELRRGRHPTESVAALRRVLQA